jgi:hypothetical protein
LMSIRENVDSSADQASPPKRSMPNAKKGLVTAARLRRSSPRS